MVEFPIRFEQDHADMISVITETSTPTNTDDDSSSGDDEETETAASASVRPSGVETGDQLPRILALHGRQSNNDVTAVQLENLHITPDRYEIVYLHGPLNEEYGDHAIEEFVSGPFYSWFEYDDNRKLKPSLIRAVNHVFNAIEQFGPFDAIYGFSQGATVAVLVALAHVIPQFRDVVLMPKNSMKVQKVKKNPFDYMVLACGAWIPDTFHKVFGLSEKDYSSVLDIPSLHLICVRDPRKPYAEQLSRLFSNAQVKYIAGEHAITRRVRDDADLIKILHQNMLERDNKVTMKEPEMRKVSKISSIGVMSPLQVAVVKLEGLIEDPTIIKVLGVRNPSKPLLYNARECNSSKCTTYGDVLSFIQGGAGDLRRIGVKTGEVVAYGAPPGGGAVPALALLSIISQTTAAPLAPNTTEAEALDLLERCNAKHLILFDGVESPGLEAAFGNLVERGRATLHRATIRQNGKPGMFDYKIIGPQGIFSKRVPSGNPLRNPTNGVALLLGTSGTTAKPKIVPILHGALVQNGNILSNSIGLLDTDVCYSIMPLFHIGGISASIMCTIASGGSICCDGEAYSPENMVDAIALSNPQPSWYSSVPTLHNATVSFIKDSFDGSMFTKKLQKYGIDENGVWKSGHSLRMIRSGAAALHGPDAMNLSTTYGDVPVFPTYSMSEQMPISQPPTGKTDMLLDKPGSVGVPIATSLAVVNSTTLKPLPHGQEGEIAICGPTVIKSYLNNEEADKQSYFELTLPIDRKSSYVRGTFFLTGDIGIMDEEGFLVLKGRNKEMVKKAGEQISIIEIEEVIVDHPWVKSAVGFAVPSKLYGEEVGLALVLSSSAPPSVNIREVKKTMREFLKRKEISPLKWPTKWKIVEDREIPKTKSNKYIRFGLAETLGLVEDIESNLTLSRSIPMTMQVKNNTLIDWDVINGFRFVLACYVMFMHIGSNSSWGVFNRLRGWPWHVHVFFTLGGYSLVAPMNPVIEKKFKYFRARIGAMYPMYIVALLFALINLLVTCRPSTFRSDFHWNAQHDDLYNGGLEENGYAPLFCEGTPATPNSYWGSLALTLIVYLFGVAITPVWAINWWMGYYFWFSAVYYQCLMIFPSVYNSLFKWRSKTKKLTLLLGGLMLINLILLYGTWFYVRGARHYGDSEDAYMDNAIVLGWYLFSPFWMIYFVTGAVAAFLYDAYRPAEKANSRMWGHVADLCTLIMIVFSILLLLHEGADIEMRPGEVDYKGNDVAVAVRFWDTIVGRLFAPLTTLWIFALSTGEGCTAVLFRHKYLVNYFAPHAYNCFLFHQVVAQWYLAATRKGHWWNWWRYRKEFYWFSPHPCPVEWYEFFFLVILTTGFSALMQNLFAAESFFTHRFKAMSSYVRVKYFQGDVVDPGINRDAESALIGAIEDMTGIEPQLDWTLDQCGLSSVGLPQLAGRLGMALSSQTVLVAISTKELSKATTVGDIVKVVESTMLRHTINETGHTVRCADIESLEDLFQCCTHGWR